MFSGCMAAGRVLLVLLSLCPCEKEGERRETEGGRETVDRSLLHQNMKRADDTRNPTLPETNMETRKGPNEDYTPSKRVPHGFPC